MTNATARIERIDTLLSALRNELVLGVVAHSSRPRTGRTEQMNIRVTPEFKALVSALADTEGCLITEVIEKAIEMYVEAQRP